MLKKMKIKKFSFIKKLIFTILFGISSVCLLGGWTYNSETQTLTSDNIIEFNNGTISDGNINITIDNNIITIIGNTNDVNSGTVHRINIPLKNTISMISNNRYYCSLHESTGDVISTIGVTESIDFISNSRLVFTIGNYTQIKNSLNFYTFNANYLFIGLSGQKTYNTILKVMFNDSPINSTNYEQPNQTFINKNLYDTLQSQYESLEIDYEETYDNLQNLQDSYNELQQNFQNLTTLYNDLHSDYTDLQNEYSNLQLSYNQLQQQYQNLLDSLGTTSFDISQYSVSVGSVPNQPSFDYTKDRDINNNFSTIGYLNVSDIYSTYIYNNNAQINNNNSIYITTPQSNLLTFDMVLNYTTQPNTIIKTTLTLPNGDTQQFIYSSTDFNYKGEWTLANLVGSSSIGANYDINDISYKDVIITYENVGNNLSDIKLGSNNGYNTGFNSGYNTALDRINELSVELNEKTTQLQQTTEELAAKTIQYNNLYARFQDLSSQPLQLNFQSLLWNIASTPFEVFKTMWNFDFLGFNIAQFITR